MTSDAPLVLALRSAAARSALAVDLHLAPGVLPLVLEAPISCVVLSAVANATRDVHVQHLTVKVWIENRRVVAEIEDDGIGGVTAMPELEERARAASGTVELDSPPGVGTLVRAEIPLGRVPSRGGLRLDR